MIRENIKSKSKRKIRLFLLLYSFLIPNLIYAQGRTHTFLLGYDVGLADTNVTSTKARLLFDSVSVTVVPETRKMAFEGGQANISDENGNFLLSSNGCWIANAIGDTIQNGSGLNPGSFANNWCSNTGGIPYMHSNILLPYPGDTTKYVLFHQTGNYALNNMSSELYYTVIDMTLANGLGGVPSGQKNMIVIHDTLGQGMAACKHANGRDWWIVILKDSTDIVYKILLTPNGISSITTQHLNVYSHNHFNGQPTFSPDGSKFAYSFWHLVANVNIHDVRLFDFDRCTGQFSNSVMMDIVDGHLGLGLAFSPNSKYLYGSSCCTIFQINVDSLTLDTVAINDGFASPHPPFYTDFFLMYLAANGKIYISSGNSVIDMHFINQPDSAGLACDVHQHGLHTPCYFFRSNVYHPNYYLGPVVGSACDTLGIGVEEYTHDFHFTVSPNPSNGVIKIIYLLPQSKSGLFEIYDINGRKVFTYNLSPWSTLQIFNIPYLKNGVYVCTITSNGNKTSRKIVVMK